MKLNPVIISISTVITSGIASGLAGKLLSQRKIFTVTLVPENLSFRKAAIIGAIIGANLEAAIHAEKFIRLYGQNDQQVNYEEKWTAVAVLISWVGTCYFSGFQTALTLNMAVYVSEAMQVYLLKALITLANRARSAFVGG
jgi:hypothetical protein